MATTTERRERLGGTALAWLAVAVLNACGSPPAEAPAAAAAESWSVTAWGERFEIFPEAEPLVAGEAAVAHTHVTRLDGFDPLVDGRVEIVLRGSGGEQVFAADQPVRPGIFSIAVEPESPGEHELVFRVRDSGGSEEIRGGKVRVGTAREPGALLVAPAPKAGSDGGDPLAFLKEEQWRTDFASAWVRSGRLARSVAGLARVRPPAGGERLLTAPVDGVVQPPAGSRWPYAGLRVERGTSLLRVLPLVATDRSLATLEAELAALTTELGTARARRSRLEELLALEATSRREVEEARVREETLEARRSAAARDLEGARSSRHGGDGGSGLDLRAPFAGRVAEVRATPGSTVTAGDPLARVVRTDRVWIEVALPPAGASLLAAEGVRGMVLSDPERPPVRIEEGLRLVSIAPELSPQTGTVSVFLEAPGSAGLTLGTALESQVLTAEQREGIVIPASALVDDGGIAVVYLQLSGESFVRQEVQVLERQGELLLVENLVPGQRLVTRGGDAIRRSSLMASGEAHGHVH